MNCSELIAKLLPVKHVFLLPGGGNAPLVEAFADRAVPMLHEHSAMVAAEAYAQCTGFGLALVTTGPGVTNAMTGLAAAYLDSTPVMLLSGQVKNEYRASVGLRQRGFQELQNVSLTRPITKDSSNVFSPTYTDETTQELFYTATSGRKGPVHLDVPLDVQLAEAERWQFVLARREQHDAQAAVARAVEMLAKSERPVILLGNGARCDEVQKLIESIGLPTLLTWRAADFMGEQHSLFCGRPGIAGQRGANIVQQSADLIICVGARMDLGQTGYDVSKFAPNAKKLVIDIDEAEAKKHRWEHAVCDGAEFLRELIQYRPFPAIERQAGFRDWYTWCKATHVKYRPRNAFYDTLSELLQPDDVIVCGSSGAAAESTLQHISIKQGQRLIFSPGLGSMGFGLPAAIGAQLATGKRVVCIEGDGSLAMNSYELETLRRLDLPIKLFVICNGGYASIVTSQNRAGYMLVVPDVPSPACLADYYELQRNGGSTSADLDSTLKHNDAEIHCVYSDCSLSHRMQTNPPGSPEDMLPALDPVEHEEAMRLTNEVSPIS